MGYFNWKPEEEFKLLGVELEYYVKLLDAKLNTPEAKDILAAFEFKRLLDKKIEEGLKEGKIKEIEDIKEKDPN